MCLHSSLLVGENNAGARLDGGVGEADAVLCQAGDRHEDPTGLAIVGGNGDARDAHVGGVDRGGSTVNAIKPLDVDAREDARERGRVDGRANINH